jgi:hypothetical protein
MKSRKKARFGINRALYLFFVVCLFTSAGVAQRTTPQITEDIDWTSFLSRHDLVWERMPDDYYNAPFLGNGLLGAMLYRPSGESLRLDIGRTDVTEKRDTDANNIVDRGRLPIGHFTLEMNYDPVAATGRLDLHNAEARFEITTANQQKLRLRALVLKSHDAVVVELEKPEALQCQWMFHPAASIVPRNPKVGVRHLNPAPAVSVVDGIRLCTQKRDAGGSYTTAWKVIEDGSKMRILITVQDSYPGDGSDESAMAILEKLAEKGVLEQELVAHEDWWHDYYRRSFVSVPHVRMESVYWIQLYKFASMMRKGGPLCDLMGPWYKKTGWPGIWWNLNTQMLYSSLHVSNQLELFSTLPDHLERHRDQLIQNIPEQWRYDAAGISRCTGQDLDESILTWPNAQSPERSNLIYLCYYLWEYYRMTMDDAYLSEQLFPLLKRAVNLLLHEVTVDEHGVIHTPYGHSPESTNGPDTNYDLSSLKWGCETLLRINQKLGLGDPTMEKWEDIVRNLRPFPADENGYMVSAEESAPLMHRHWCHLFQIYPYYLVNWEQPENRDVILTSIKHWGSPEIPNTWTQCVISSMYSSVRDGDNALKHMDLALASPNFYPNTMHAEGRNPCSETYGGLGRMLQDMLIQSWGGVIRVFPGVPDEWDQAVFHNLRAEGGFEVSARRENGATNWVRIRSHAGEPCVIEAGLVGTVRTTNGGITKLEGGRYRLRLKKGQEAILYVSSYGDLHVQPVDCDAVGYNVLERGK